MFRHISHSFDGALKRAVISKVFPQLRAHYYVFGLVQFSLVAKAFLSHAKRSDLLFRI
jgi:hypothetical protein